MLCWEAATKITTRGPVSEGCCIRKVKPLLCVFTRFLTIHINRISRDSHMDDVIPWDFFQVCWLCFERALLSDLFSFHHHSRGRDFTNEPGSALSVFRDSSAGTSKAIHCIKSNLLEMLDNTNRLTKSYFFSVCLLPGLPGTVHVQFPLKQQNQTNTEPHSSLIYTKICSWLLWEEPHLLSTTGCLSGYTS